MLALALVLLGCNGGSDEDMLSALGLLEYEGEGVFTYSDGIVPYDLNSALYSDHASKDRAISIPAGEAATYDAEAAFDFPVGTILIKSFSFPADLRSPDEDIDLVETRLLVLEEDGWTGKPYIWNEDETDAVYTPAGDSVPMTLIDENGESLEFGYTVPQRNQCEQCHTLQDTSGGNYMTPIGTKARHLSRDNAYDGETVDQLDHLAALGMLDGLPAEGVPAAYDFRDVLDRGVDALSSAEVTDAARDWLDINCAHCHNPSGITGVTTQLFLNHDNDVPFNYGVCKIPGSAGAAAEGRTWDVVPGDHEASILWFRMSTTDQNAMMPLIGRATTYEPASELIARWIDELPGDCAAVR